MHGVDENARACCQFYGSACTERVRGVSSRVITHEYKRPCTHWRQLALPAGATWYSQNATGQSALMQSKEKKSLCFSAIMIGALQSCSLKL